MGEKLGRVRRRRGGVGGADTQTGKQVDRKRVCVERTGEAHVQAGTQVDRVKKVGWGRRVGWWSVSESKRKERQVDCGSD